MEMAAVNLTEGAIAMLSSGDAQYAEIKPIVQVSDIRLVNTSSHASNVERYRLVLSDGTWTQQGMLGTQLNDYVRSDQLQKGTIIQLTQFVCNLIQNKRIIIIVDLAVIVERCEVIGTPKPYQINGDMNVSPSAASSMSQIAGGGGSGNTPSYGTNSTMSGRASGQIMGGGAHVPHSGDDRNAGSNFHSNPLPSNMESGRYNSFNNSPVYPKAEVSSGVSRPPMNSYARPPQSLYNQPPPAFANRGPIAKNEAPPRIIPIAALNPYQGRWTIKARVTVKGELRHYNNPRGDGKVFSFDLLDSDGGEIRVTCFNTVADQFYNQIEPGKIYMISKGTLKPAQKAYNHLRNDHEIMLDSTSTVQPCFEDDKSIPQQQFHFRPISDIEGLESNSVVDVIAVVSSISPSSSIMRKNGTETLKRTLQLKDMSGKSVELTLWGQFCNAEGQTLQNMCDSGVFPVLAVKAARVNDFNGKTVGTISTSQLFIDPDFPEAQKLRIWFDNDGKSTPAISISRETSMARTDVRKCISQIKDEKLGTSEKPDWITVSATLTFIKVDNFCYTACPLMIGDRQCNKKVINNGDGKWRCERCDKLVDECDYRYILQMQIQDHTGLTWVTAFQESGEEIMGVSAKELYYMKYEEQDDEKFNELMRGVLFTKFLFKLKVKEEFFSDEQRVKSTVVKADKLNFQTETKYLLDSIAKFKEGDSGSVPPKVENVVPTAPATNYSGINSSVARESSVSQISSFGNQYAGSRIPAASSTGMYKSCSSCGVTGHNSEDCPSIMSAPGQSYGSGFINKVASSGGGGSGGTSGECFKCHQHGHWARDCPGTNNVPPAYGSSNATSGRYGMASKQHVGGF